MESAVSFAPLRPAGFLNFAGRGKDCFLQGGAGQPVFPLGGATIPGLNYRHLDSRQLIVFVRCLE